jgi:EF hand/EF-hand domain pair
MTSLSYDKLNMAYNPRTRSSFAHSHGQRSSNSIYTPDSGHREGGTLSLAASSASIPQLAPLPPPPKPKSRLVVDLADFRDAFSLLNDEGGDTITARGLTDFMITLGMRPTEAEAFEMMAQLDKDGSGAIDFEEMMVLIAALDTDSLAEMHEAFKMFDVNHDGFIDEQDFAAVAVK